MITRLEVDGFKSLRDFEIDFESFTVLVGPNGAGKSNILEALGLISRLGERRAPEDALKQGRGRAGDQFWRHAQESARSMRLALETLEPDQHDVSQKWAARYRHELQLTRHEAGAGERVQLKNMPARRLGTAQDRWLASHSEWHGFTGWPLDAADIDEEYEFLPFFSLLQLNAAQLRDPSERIDTGELAPDASNLPTVLASLPTTILGDVRAELAGLIPGIADFELIERDESYQIEFRTRDGDTVPARLASDGTLRMLALLTAVVGKLSWNSVVCIEEPENGIYPGRLRRLIDLLREATSAEAWRTGAVDSPPPQVIVTTHSPVFLTALKDHPQSIRYIDVIRKDRYRVTRARPLATSPGADPAKLVSPREIEAVLGGIWSSEGDR
jgi:predicted ATPase